MYAASGRRPRVTLRFATLHFARPAASIANRLGRVQGGSSGIFNSGSITLNSTGTATKLLLNAPEVGLYSGGTLTLSDNAANSVIAAASGSELDNYDNTISGAGTIGNANLTLTNHVSGVIDATGAHALIINT